MNESPNTATERAWLAQGLKEGQIREETAVAIMKLLENLSERKADEYNNLSVYPALGTEPTSDQFPNPNHDYFT